MSALQKKDKIELNLSTIGNLHTAGTLSVSSTVFDRDYNEALIHQVVVAYMAAARTGSKSAKKLVLKWQVVGKNHGGKKELVERGLELHVDRCGVLVE